MAIDRLDAIIIGANVEGLFAAVELARAGRQIAVLERHPIEAAAGEGRDAVVSVAAVRELNLSQHGLRLASAPAVVGVTSDQALILWPDTQAAQASIATVSPHDADAFENFRARIGRAVRSKSSAGMHSLTAWLLSANTLDEPPPEHILFRAAPLARWLNEFFDSEVLKGMLAQGALMGTAVSPHAPGSAVLLARQTGFAGDDTSRFVAGGDLELRRALLATLKFYNNADIHFGADVSEIVAEREAVYSVRLTGGAVFAGSAVISTLGRERTGDLLAGGRQAAGNVLPLQGAVKPAQVKFTVVSAPKLPGVDAATVASGAIVRLNPDIERLTRAHGAFRAHQVPQEPCLEFRVIPRQIADGIQRWEVFVSELFIPAETSEGSWSGNRRERLVAHCMNAVEALAPGFSASVEAAVLSHPKETQTVMDAKRRGQGGSNLQPESATVPLAAPSIADSILKGLIAIDTSMFEPAGEGGLLAAHSIGLNKRAKGQADA
ncbi:MAG: hypothetical protein SGJ03_09220 [Alphaproteobacteria bacterium]|nr:hypothetical protein [Alphaproteobacteria bacterium]